MDFLKKHEACLQINSLSELETAITDFIKHPKKFTVMGDNAKNALQKQSTILDHYLSIIINESE